MSGGGWGCSVMVQEKYGVWVKRFLWEERDVSDFEVRKDLYLGRGL